VAGTDDGLGAMKRRIPLLASAIAFALAVLFLFGTREYRLGTLARPGPGLYPFLIAVLLVMSTAGSIVEALRAKSSGAAIEWPDGAGWLRIATIMIATVGYIMLVSTLGDLVSGIVATLMVTRAMGMSSWARAGLLAVATAIGLHVLFSVVLGVPLPHGVLFG
jgi:putative tricarboxylic transport membrane protein